MSATNCIRENYFSSEPTSMDQQQSNLEESVIRRTVCVIGLGSDAVEQDVIDSLRGFGEIQYVRMDAVNGGGDKVALVQYADEKSAEELVRQVQIRILDRVVRLRQSSITIEVIPPTDAVFGKPMTVGRHVMAVNLAKEQRGRDRELLHKVQHSRKELISVLERISRSTGWRIPDRTLEILSSERDDPMASDKRGGNSRSISARASRSRSRSSRSEHRHFGGSRTYRRRY